MKTPREVFKENFWIGAKGGLVDKKHYLKMGITVWLFLHLLREQTGLNQHGEGIVNYGHPLTFQQIGSDMKGIPAETIRMWAAVLRREHYIRTETHGHSGLTFWIAKGKAKTRKVRVTHEQAHSMKSAQTVRLSRRGNPNGEEIPPRANPNGEPTSPRGSTNGKREPGSPQVFASEFLAEICDSSIPKGLTPENLSYYNKSAAAQTAAGPFSLLRDTARQMQIPRRMSAAELDARRRELLLQAEEIMRKHPRKEQPGKVAVIRREAVVYGTAGQKPGAENGALSLAAAR